MSLLLLFDFLLVVVVVVVVAFSSYFVSIVLTTRTTLIRTAQLASSGVQPPNWPFAFYPILYHDIEAEIPQPRQALVRLFYILVLCTCATVCAPFSLSLCFPSPFNFLDSGILVLTQTHPSETHQPQLKLRRSTLFLNDTPLRLFVYVYVYVCVCVCLCVCVSVLLLFPTATWVTLFLNWCCIAALFFACSAGSTAIEFLWSSMYLVLGSLGAWQFWCVCARVVCVRVSALS